jgi:hypothetical protein
MTATAPEPENPDQVQIDPALKCLALSRQRDEALEKAANWEAVAMALRVETTELRQVVAHLQQREDQS